MEFVNLFLNGVFTFSMDISMGLLSPAVSILKFLLPDMQNVFTTLVEYFNTILQFVPLALDFCMIPRSAMVFLFDFYVIKFTIYLVTRTVKLVLNLYNKFKP